MTSLQIPEEQLSNLSGKGAIITGASSGIGLETSLLFASKEVRVIIADLSPPKVVVPGSSFIKTDVTSWSSLLELFAQAGEVDIVVANAGVGKQEFDFVDSDDPPKEPDYSPLEVNLKGTFNTVKLAVHYMRKQRRGGNIILTASRAGYMPNSFAPMYSCSKAGVIALMRAVKNSLPEKISISVVAPAATRTPMVEAKTLELLDAAGKYVQPPSTVAMAIGYLASMGYTVNGWGITVNEGKYVEVEGSVESCLSAIDGVGLNLDTELKKKEESEG